MTYHFPVTETISKDFFSQKILCFDKPHSLNRFRVMARLAKVGMAKGTYHFTSSISFP
jgi:hypothetical protein